MAAGAVSLRKSHDIVILSFCNIVKGQAISVVFVGYLQNYQNFFILATFRNENHKIYKLNILIIGHIYIIITCILSPNGSWNTK